MKEKISNALGELPAQYIEEAAAWQKTAAKGFSRRMTALAAAIALLLFTGVGLTALAAGNEAFNDALYRVFPGLAQALKPVQLSCEDNGIRMEVISAQVEDGTAHVYLSLQDLTGDRIDGTVDLFDSYYMNLPADSITGHCEQIAYDPETHTATFLCTLEGWDNARLSDKVTFSLGCFISGKQDVTCDVLTFVPAELGAGTQWEGVLPRGYGYSDDNPPVKMEMLLPGEVLAEPVDGIQLTGLAYLGGRLHIQHHYADVMYLDFHGFPTLIGPDGAELPGIWSISAFDESRVGSYEDDVFELLADATGPYTIRGEYTIATRHAEGRWRVTFPVGN